MPVPRQTIRTKLPKERNVLPSADGDERLTCRYSGIAASIFLYRIRPLAGISFGSTAIALAVLAHLGILAAVVGPLVAWRRRLTNRRR